MGSVALTGVSSTDQDAALEAASRKADSLLSIEGRYVVPLTAYGSDLTVAVCHIAAFWLLSKKPFSPDGAETVPKKLHDAAIKWLTDCGLGNANITGGITTATPTVQPEFYTTTRRGWGA